MSFRKEQDCQSFAYISSHALARAFKKIQYLASRINRKNKDTSSEKKNIYLIRMHFLPNGCSWLIRFVGHPRTHHLEGDLENRLKYYNESSKT